MADSPGQTRPQKTGEPVRIIALEALLAFERNPKRRLKADALIAEQLKNSPESITGSDRRLLQALVLGTLRQQARLNAWIETLSGRPLKRIEPVVRVLLRLGLFQLEQLEQVPSYAAINTTVELARQRTSSRQTVKFVNAILREAQRALETGVAPGADETDDPIKHFLWEFAWPEDWTRAVLKTYTLQEAQFMAEACRKPAKLSIRVNTLKTEPAAYQQALREAGLAPQLRSAGETLSPAGDAQQSGTRQRTDFSFPEALMLERWPGSVQELPGYREGWFYVQDPASMWVSKLVDPKPGERILDLCAAPGSKTGHMAALSQNRALITALEPVPRRVALLRENIARLGIENVTVIQTDALVFEPDLDTPLYDKVLVDAPCSGSGTLRRHPEILPHVSPPRLKESIAQQRALLEKGLACLQAGGILIYSTCSILPAENQRQIQAFLEQHPHLTLAFEEQRLITEDADGFYAAKIVNNPL